MKCTIEIKGYRCFSPSSPLRLTLDDGILSFVGPNNSGKSTALRFFYEFRGLLHNVTKTDWWQKTLQGSRVAAGTSDAVRDKTSLFTHGYSGPITVTISLDCPAYTRSKKATVSRVRLEYNRNEGTSMRVLDTDFLELDTSYPTHRWVTEDDSLLHYFNRTYFLDISPWQNALGPLVNSCYLPAFRNVHNAVLENGHYYDCKMGKQFIQQWREWRSGDSNHSFDLVRRVEDDIKRLMGFETLFIDSTTRDDDLWLIIDGKRQRLSEIGSGIAQFVIAFGNIAMRKPQCIMIDEPELNLHPSLQVDFVQSLAKYGPSRIMFATHSIGLARSISKRVYCTRRDNTGSTRVEVYSGSTRLPEFLGLMQYSGYAALGFTHVLLVEGPTEVLVFHEWLRLFGIDHSVVVLPLGGNGMIDGDREHELSEVQRISPNVWILIDSEKRSPEAKVEERDVFLALCKRLKINARATVRRCTERYFTERAIRAAFPKHQYGALPEHADADLEWDKNDNWRIAANMTKDEMLATDIGTLLKDLAASVLQQRFTT